VLDDGHAAAESPVRLGKFEADVTAAEDEPWQTERGAGHFSESLE
jgi:hypothetical protein